MVHYRRIGTRAIELANPLGPPVPLGMCRNCQAVDLSPDQTTLICPVCGSGPPDFGVVRLAQPHGFRTLYEGGRDFDGVFEWTPRASRPKTDAAQLTMTAQLNFEFWSDAREVCVINDNDRRLFEFQKALRGETWLTQDAVEQINAPNELPTGFLRFRCDTRQGFLWTFEHWVRSNKRTF